MQTNLKAMRKYDAGLILITLVAVVAFVSVLFSLSPNTRACLLYTSPSPRDAHESRMPSSA